jgi:hypothetical protein
MSDRLPTEPGQYFWDVWNKEVDVYSCGNSLFVRVFSHWPRVKISPRIAGKFTKVGTTNNANVTTAPGVILRA